VMATRGRGERQNNQVKVKCRLLCRSLGSMNKGSISNNNNNKLRNLNEKLDRLFSIITLLPTSSVRHYMTTKNPSSTIDSNMHDTLYSTHPKHDTLPTQNQLDLYNLMSTLLPTIYNPINHRHKLKHTLLTALLSQPKNSQEATYSSMYSGNLSAKSSTGTPYTLQKNLPQPPPYSKDLWKPS